MEAGVQLDRTQRIMIRYICGLTVT